MREFVTMELADVKRVTALEQECFQGDAWSEKLFLEELQQENKHYIVCKEEGIVIAYGGFSQVLDEGHMMNIAVDGRARRQGVAYEILIRMETLAITLGIKSLTLEVREGNLPARTLYEKAGFLLAGVRKGYYRDKENACIYWKVL